jgi:hypothetical protein
LRFIDDHYRHLADGLCAAQQLDERLRKHPAVQARYQRRLAQQRKRRQLAGIITGALWASLPFLGGFALLGKRIPAPAGELLTTLSCSLGILLLTGAVLASLVTAILLAGKHPPTLKRSVYSEWLNVVAKAALPSLDALKVRFSRNGRRSIEEYTHYGSEGVWRTLRALNSRLRDQWFALTNVMISRSEDADIVLIGPSGIWILESKYWSGIIKIENGSWSRDKTYYVKGGFRKSQHDRIDKPWDAQWLRQRDAVVHVLKEAHILTDGQQSSEFVAGGVVLSNSRARLKTDGSQKAQITHPGNWAGRLRQSESAQWLTIEDRLRIVDALLAASHRNRRTSEPGQSAVRPAEHHFQVLLAEVQRH